MLTSTECTFTLSDLRSLSHRIKGVLKYNIWHFNIDPITEVKKMNQSILKSLTFQEIFT